MSGIQHTMEELRDAQRYIVHWGTLSNTVIRVVMHFEDGRFELWLVTP